MTTQDEIIGRKVRAAREAAGFTRPALAEELEALGIEWQVQTIQRIEGGDRALQVAELPDLAGCLGVSVSALLHYDDDEQDIEITRAQGSVQALRRRTGDLKAAVAAWTTANADARSAIHEAKNSASGSVLPEVVEQLAHDREAAQAQAVSIITNAQKAVKK